MSSISEAELVAEAGKWVDQARVMVIDAQAAAAAQTLVSEIDRGQNGRLRLLEAWVELLDSRVALLETRVGIDSLRLDALEARPLTAAERVDLGEMRLHRSLEKAWNNGIGGMQDRLDDAGGLKNG